jgi:hypothetical protein
MYSELSLVSAYTRELGNVTPRATPLVAGGGCVWALTIVTLSSDVVIATAAHAADVLVDLMTFDLWMFFADNREVGAVAGERLCSRCQYSVQRRRSDALLRR